MTFKSIFISNYSNILYISCSTEEFTNFFFMSIVRQVSNKYGIPKISFNMISRSHMKVFLFKKLVICSFDSFLYRLFFSKQNIAIFVAAALNILISYSFDIFCLFAWSNSGERFHPYLFNLTELSEKLDDWFFFRIYANIAYKNDSFVSIQILLYRHFIIVIRHYLLLNLVFFQNLLNVLHFKLIRNLCIFYFHF